MFETAKIQDWSVDQEGTHLEIWIPGRNLLEFLAEKLVHNCGLWLEDGRHITAAQRKKIYATVRDISEYTGYLPEEQKEWLKYLHIERTGCQYFSLSTCSITTAREYINTILDYALEAGIPLTDLAINRTDDIGRYLYSCIMRRRCCVCGQPGEIHHVDAIGMGRDRRKVDDCDSRKICLCRKHHTEAHNTGMSIFEQRHKVYGIKITSCGDQSVPAA
ncbi:Protein of uncharacterised function (DUF968) [uncultured Clostridium sp.]|nr:putative HNHc nuclease [Suonthocola fibrivorans]SCJ58938.1 Protein of uncharacterised function (DUF968) [uncultured Clostridium sp.]